MPVLWGYLGFFRFTILLHPGAQRFKEDVFGGWVGAFFGIITGQRTRTLTFFLTKLCRGRAIVCDMRVVVDFLPGRGIYYVFFTEGYFKVFDGTLGF